MAGQVGNLLAGRDVVEGDDARIASRCEQLSLGRECDGADWLDETWTEKINS